MPQNSLEAMPKRQLPSSTKGWSAGVNVSGVWNGASLSEACKYGSAYERRVLGELGEADLGKLGRGERLDVGEAVVAGVGADKDAYLARGEAVNGQIAVAQVVMMCCTPAVQLNPVIR